MILMITNLNNYWHLINYRKLKFSAEKRQSDSQPTIQAHLLAKNSDINCHKNPVLTFVLIVYQNKIVHLSANGYYKYMYLILRIQQGIKLNVLEL